ncbi:MAG: hypothetical protein ACREXW_03065 [Gammaproteobacteria bacterium]
MIDGYDPTRSWSFKAEAGIDSAVELFYSIDYDYRPWPWRRLGRGPPCIRRNPEASRADKAVVL